MLLTWAERKGDSWFLFRLNGRMVQVLMDGEWWSYARLKAHITTEEFQEKLAQKVAEGRAFWAGRKPSLRQLECWASNGACRAVDGCRVEPDGDCPHGAPSWLVVLGLI